MDSKQANRIRSNGIAQAREDSRWMRKRIAELEAERRELVDALKMSDELIVTCLHARTPVITIFKTAHTTNQALLAKIDKENGDE